MNYSELIYTPFCNFKPLFHRKKLSTFFPYLLQTEEVPMVLKKFMKALRNWNTKIIVVHINPAVPKHDEEFIPLENL